MLRISTFISKYYSECIILQYSLFTFLITIIFMDYGISLSVPAPNVEYFDRVISLLDSDQVKTDLTISFVVFLDLFNLMDYK